MSEDSRIIDSSSGLFGVPPLVATKPNEKKRARPLKSCLLCRQKKIKCDQLKPACSSCLKRGAHHLCKYEDTKWNVKTSPNDRDTNRQIESPLQVSELFTSQNTRSPPNLVDVTTSKDVQLIQMNKRIRHLEDAVKNSNRFTLSGIQPDTNASPVNNSPSLDKQSTLDYEDIDFYKQLLHIPLDLNHGALSWGSLLKKDVYLNSIAITATNLKSILTNAESMSASQSDKEFLKKWRREDNNTELLFEPETKNKYNLIDQLNFHLKDPKLIWLLIDRFFNSELYMVLPLIDKEEFSIKVLGLIGSKGVSQVKLVLKNKADLTIIGILLLIMRLSSLSSYNCGKKPFNQDTDSLYILNNPINKDVINVVNKIQAEVSGFRAMNVEAYQFFILRLSYNYYDPDECDCMKYVNSSSIGQVLQFAVQCGLNRDPDSLPNPALNSLDPKRKNLLRRLWYSVVFLDSYQLMTVGCPPIIDSKFYDTQCPHLNESRSELEYTANEWSYERSKLYEICCPLLISIMNVRTKTTVGEVKALLSPILAYAEKLKTVEEIVQAPRDRLIDRCNKIKDVTILIDCTSLLYMIYYHLFLFYNEHNEKNESLKYFIEMVRISTDVFGLLLFLEPNATEYDLEKHFGNGSLVLPKIEMALHKISPLLFSTLSRIKGLKAFSTDLSPETIQVVDDIADIARQTQVQIITRFYKMSELYYHPWVVSKAHSFILKNLLNIEKGGNFSADLPGDYQFIKSFYKSRNLDQMFHLFTLEDFQSIKFEFMKFDKILCKYDIEPLEQLPFNNDCDVEVEKRWIDQIMNDYTNLSTSANAELPTLYDSFNMTNSVNLSVNNDNNNNSSPYEMGTNSDSKISCDSITSLQSPDNQHNLQNPKYEETNQVETPSSTVELDKNIQSDQILANNQYIDRLFSPGGINEVNLF